MTCARRGVEFARELASTLIPLYCWVSRPCPLLGVSGEARHSCAEIAPSAMIFWGMGGVRCASSLWFMGDVRGQGCSGKRVSLETDASVGFRSLFVFLWKALPACSGKRLKLDMCLGCRCPGRCCFSRQRVSSLFGETRQASFFVGNYAPSHKPPSAQLLHFAQACERSVSARAKHIALGDRFLARGTLHALPRCDEAANFGQPSANHWTTPKIGTPL